MDAVRTPPRNRPLGQPPEGRTRRERNRDRVHEHIYGVAIALFTEHGYDATTMDDIADRADVARGTVFNHFPRKNVFIEEWLLGRRRAALEAVYAEPLEQPSMRSVLERLLLALADVNEATRPETVAMMRAAIHSTNILREPELATEVAALLSSAGTTGGDPTRAELSRLGLIVTGTYLAVLTQWVEENPPFALAAELTAMLDIIARGFE